MPGWLRPLSACGAALAWLTFTAGAQPVEPREARAVFHHLHLVSGEPDQLADFYDRLFVRGAVARGQFWETEGIRGNGVFLLVSGNVQGRPRNLPTGLWHFGWGTGTIRESLNQTYAEHYATDVNWRPPYETLVKGFHLHLRSADPVAAGEWYADVLGGSVERPPRNEDSRRDPRDITQGVQGNINSEPPRLAVSFGDIVLFFHDAGEPLVSTRDAGLADHLAFAVRDLPSTLLRVPHDNDPAAGADAAGANSAPRPGAAPNGVPPNGTAPPLAAPNGATPSVTAPSGAAQNGAAPGNAAPGGVNAGQEQYGLKDQRAVMITGPDKVIVELIQQPKGPGFWSGRP